MILVPLEHCSKKHKILVKCDICGKEQEIWYSTYIDSTKNMTQIYCCKGVCSNIKREQTNMILYGVKNCFQNERMKETAKETMIERYGVDHNMKTQKCLDDRVETYRKNYGCDNPTQNHEVLIKSFSKGNKIHLFRNTDIYYQASYELDFLEKYYDLINVKRGPSINYIYNGKNKVYHSDFYIKDFNLIVEIKSSYWLKKFKHLVDIQEKEVRKNYNYILIVNKNYNEFIQIIEN